MKTFKSKFGYRILGFLTVIFGLVIGLMIYKGEQFEAILSVVGIVLSVIVFFLYLNFSTNYTLTDQGTLKIRCGIFYYKEIDISKIKSIVKSNNLISSPAPSLDRIELAYGKFDLIIISPKNQEVFAEELTRINPKIENNLR